MKNSTLSICSSVLLFLFILLSCQKTEIEDSLAYPDLPEETYDYSAVTIPSSLGDPIPTNAISSEQATLGRVLFYDRHLSQNNSTSCGSCHFQSLAFSDGKQFSRGLHGKQTSRNSMALSNAIFESRFFWDHRADNLEEQVLMPIEDHIEMGVENIGNLPPKLEAVDYYPALFENAFGSSEITEERISIALAMFLKSMVALNTRFGNAKTQNFSSFSSKEKLGMELFNGKALCRNCHGSQTFSGWGTDNIGLDLHYEDEGSGNGRFSKPSLINIALTAPYMHDGRFNTLEEVVNHYNEGIQNHPGLSWTFRTSNGPKRLGLNELEKEALIAFLETLTDESFLTDVRYSDPFR